MSDLDSNDPRDRELWQLIGQARRVEASPFFTRKVLRAIEEPEPRYAPWLSMLRIFAPAAVCIALAAGALLSLRGERAAAVASTNPEIEFEAIQNLDLMVANYETSLWLDFLLRALTCLAPVALAVAQSTPASTASPSPAAWLRRNRSRRE